LIGHFYNNSKGKIRKQSIEKRFTHTDSLKIDWLGLDWNDDKPKENLLDIHTLNKISKAKLYHGKTRTIKSSRRVFFAQEKIPNRQLAKI